MFPKKVTDPAKVKYMGTGQWDQPGIGTEPTLVGGWFAAPAAQGYADFSRRFQTAFGRAPVRIASIAYDATALAAALAGNPPIRRYDREALENPQGFAGYDGVFRFRSDGLAERGLAVLEVQRGGFRTVVPAALPGIFGAVVLGVGRVIGETMVVLMAAGNAAINSWNPLEPVRTLSASIAAEMAGVVHGSPY